LLDQLTPVLLTLNEAPNIARTLDKLAWAKRIVVLDSGSTDQTREICEKYANVDFRMRTFTTHAEQWNFAVHETGIDTDWVLSLDADYVLSDEIVEEMRTLDAARDGVRGYVASFRYCVNGRALRGSLYPDVIVLFQRASGTYRQDGHTQRLQLEGPSKRLSAPIFHDDRKSLAGWLRSQDRYAALECEHLSSMSSGQLRLQDKLRKMMFVAPFIVPLYCLLIRGLILDGWPGLHYTLQRTIAEAILSIKLIERRIGGAK
jgi:glycosyltransferase involved in cell wall biosynthesis